MTVAEDGRRLSEAEWVERFVNVFILWGPVSDRSAAVQRMGVDRSEIRRCSRKGVK